MRLPAPEGRKTLATRRKPVVQPPLLMCVAPEGRKIGANPMRLTPLRGYSFLHDTIHRLAPCGYFLTPLRGLPYLQSLSYLYKLREVSCTSFPLSPRRAHAKQLLARDKLSIPCSPRVVPVVTVRRKHRGLARSRLDS
jgi:hypothetical protein